MPKKRLRKENRVIHNYLLVMRKAIDTMLKEVAVAEPHELLSIMDNLEDRFDDKSADKIDSILRKLESKHTKTVRCACGGTVTFTH